MALQGNSAKWAALINQESARRIEFPSGDWLIDQPLPKLRSGMIVSGKPDTTLHFTYTDRNRAVFDMEDLAEDIMIEQLRFQNPNLPETSTPTDLNDHNFCIRIGTDTQRALISDIYFGDGVLKGITSFGGNITIKDVRGTPCYQGIVLDRNGNTAAMVNVNLNVPWCPNGTAMFDWMKANGTAYIIRRVDGLNVTSCFCYNYNTGLLCELGTMPGFIGGTSGSWMGGGFDGCNYACEITGLRAGPNESDDGNGGTLQMEGVSFIGEYKAMRINSPSGLVNSSHYPLESQVRCTTCGFHSVLGAEAPAVLITHGRLYLSNCKFTNPYNFSGRNHFVTCIRGHLSIQGGEVEGVAGSLAVEARSGCRRFEVDNVVGLGGGGRIVNGATFSRIGANLLPPEYSNEPDDDELTPTTTVLTSNPNPSAIGQVVTLTATVTGDNPTGSVAFRDQTGGGNASLGTGTINGGFARITTSFSSSGTKTLRAVYLGDSTHAGSSSLSHLHVVSQGGGQTSTTTTLTSDPNPSEMNADVVLTSTTTGTGRSGTVTFFDGGVQIGSGFISTLSLDGVVEITVQFATQGVHNLLAIYGGDATHSSSQDTHDHTVTGGLIPTTLGLDTRPNPSEDDEEVTLTATVIPNLATGTVTFYDNGVSIGTAEIE